MIEELQKKAEEIKKKIEKERKTILETENAVISHKAAESQKKRLERKYYKTIRDIEHLDKYNADKELQNIIKLLTDTADQDCNKFNFFNKAEAKFTNYGEHGRQLHVNIECSQICKHDIDKVLKNAEEVTGKKIIDWFVSASIGYNPKECASAWLTYHLTFKGEEDSKNDKNN